MNFTDSPTKLMRVRYGRDFPGLGHQLTTLCYVLKYCQDNGFFPVMDDDPANAYGQWTDYFEPFWNEEQRARVAQAGLSLPVIDNDLNWVASRSGLFGERWADYATEIREIFLAIYVLKSSVVSDVARSVDALRLPQSYVSLQVRRGDKNGQFKEYGALSDKEVVARAAITVKERRVENVFVLTDDYGIVEEIRATTSFQVFTLCRPDYRGKQRHVRNSPGHTLDLLTEIAVAVGADAHFQTVRSRVSKMIRLLRDDVNCHHVFEEGYTQYTAL